MLISLKSKNELSQCFNFIKTTFLFFSKSKGFKFMIKDTPHTKTFLNF